MLARGVTLAGAVITGRALCSFPSTAITQELAQAAANALSVLVVMR